MKDAYYIRSLAVTVIVLLVVFTAMVAVVYFGGAAGFVIVVAPLALLIGAFYGVFGFITTPFKASRKTHPTSSQRTAHLHDDPPPALNSEIESREKISQVKG